MKQRILLPALCILAAALAAPGFGQACASTCTQSSDPSTIASGSVACQASTLTENSYWRVYSNDDCGIAGDMLITQVCFGIELAESGGSGSQPVNVRLHELTVPPAGGTFLLSDLVQKQEVSFNLADGLSGTFFRIDVCTKVAAGSLLAVEINTPDAAATNDRFFMGSNPAGQTGPSYISAGACGIQDPLDLALIGFPNLHYLLHLTAVEVIGDNYCPNTVNSTGVAGEISATGSASVTANDLVFTGTNLAPNETCILVSGDGQSGFIPMSSAGMFCILGTPANVGRHFPEGNTGNLGCCSTAIDNVALPIGGPAVPPIHAVMPGETWYFQYWYRDGEENNFTDAVSITFGT